MKTLLLIATSLLSAQAFAADTLTVYTYVNAAMTDPVYSSALTWNCTTGETQPVVNAGSLY